MPELIRATIAHTPNRGLEFHEDGGLLIREGRVAVCGDFAPLRRHFPEVPVTDWRGGFLLPGFIDAHVHFPQLRVTGTLGLQLLEWLEHHALPEEARMVDVNHAVRIARGFVHALASHGTTTALVFGAHFAPATAALFDHAGGLRILSGLVLSDRLLRPDLHQSPAAAYHDSTDLIRRYHGRGRLLYAVTPRFALSTSEAMLEVCQTLVRENPGLRVQSHLNENPREIAEVSRRFGWAEDYFAVYERYGLCGPRAVMAHNVHPEPAELERMADTHTSVAHCPCSNATLGSGIFPMHRHLKAGVHFALGTDVGAGTGFGMPKEALQAYFAQRLGSDRLQLSPGELLYRMTLAGAEALDLARETGSFEAGKAADFVHLHPPAQSPLAFSLEAQRDASGILGALLAQAGSESVAEVRVEGEVVYRGAESTSSATR